MTVIEIVEITERHLSEEERSNYILPLTHTGLQPNKEDLYQVGPEFPFWIGGCKHTHPHFFKQRQLK
ncbi:hypothetical protein F7725_000760, partial [Dissostichus mawsoni]